MTSSLPGTASPGESGPDPRGLRASISHAALRANAALLGEHPVVLTHDAWGHGEPEVAATLDAVSPAREPETADEGEDALATLFGLPGSAGVPVMRLSGTVLSVKPLLRGEGVSYGYTHHADADTHVALVTGGYAQGIVRSLGNRARVRVAGSMRPIVGRVAMDVCVVDIGALPVGRGDEVVFFGDPARGEPSLADWVAATGFTAAEVVTIVGQRATRVHLE